MTTNEQIQVAVHNQPMVNRLSTFPLMARFLRMRNCSLFSPGTAKRYADRGAGCTSRCPFLLTNGQCPCKQQLHRMRKCTGNIFSFVNFTGRRGLIWRFDIYVQADYLKALAEAKENSNTAPNGDVLIFLTHSQQRCFGTLVACFV